MKVYCLYTPFLNKRPSCAFHKVFCSALLMPRCPNINTKQFFGLEMNLFGVAGRRIVGPPQNNFLLWRAYSRKNREPIEVPKGKRITEPWNERKEIWKSTFAYLKPKTDFIGPDFIRLMQTPIDLSPKTVKKWYERRIENQEEHNQSFVKQRYEILGPDLAAAHFIVHRGGSVRFYNESEWIGQKEDGSYVLPSKFVAGLFIEAINCDGLNLRYTGIDNILDLEKLRWLNLANNPLVDDWSVDSISGSYGETLQYLDISNCPKISFRGLSCFYRFQKLDTLVVNGISESPEFKLSCMMLEDIKPHLTIKGIDYSIPENEKIDEPLGK